MRTFTLNHVIDADLLRSLAALVARDCENTAELLAHIAEVDARGLYLPAGYPSMHAYCIEELHLSEDAAFKRIHAARTARQFPVLFTALADGRLHMTAVRLLASYLTPENVHDLVAAATHRRRSEIEQWLAGRFPRPEMLPEIVPGISPVASFQQAPGPVGAQLTKVAPVSSERFAIQVTVDRSTHDKLRYAQDLLGHSVPSGDVAQVLDRALDALIAHLEKRKFAATPRPQRHTGPTASRRYVPAQVRRAVLKRDGGQCTFESDTGRRCSTRKRLEFDHVDPVARGGRATMATMRLRCRAHNQYEAERAFGTQFMRRKREQAKERAQRVAAAPARATDDMTKDVMAGLRELGVRADVARRAVAYSQTQGPTTLEERMRAALRFLCPKNIRMGNAVAA